MRLSIAEHRFESDMEYHKKGETMLSVKEMVKNKKVNFVKYRAEILYYKTECGFEFEVPVSDIGEGSCGAEEKAIMFMRWIKKAVHKIEQENNN